LKGRGEVFKEGKGFVGCSGTGRQGKLLEKISLGKNIDENNHKRRLKKRRSKLRGR